MFQEDPICSSILVATYGQECDTGTPEPNNKIVVNRTKGGDSFQYRDDQGKIISIEEYERREKAKLRAAENTEPNRIWWLVPLFLILCCLIYTLAKRAKPTT